MDTTKKSPIIISLCTGIRGLERGLERALQQEVRVASYVEIEAFIIANLIAGMEAGVLATAPVWANLKTFPYRGFHGKVHGIIGGYPCPPFSYAGKRKWREDPRHLWPYIWRIVQSVKPVFCFFENVEGHLNLGFEEVSRDLRKLGYNVEAGIYSAEEVGAPHQRKRLFILAILADSDHGHLFRITKGFLPEKEAERIQKWNYFQKLGQSSNLANTISERLEEFREQSAWKELTPTERGGTTSWPAGPGQQQCFWEEPRIIESGMGVTVDGYNFREDLLRAAGNGVVEQTAELAFIDLLRKHYLK